MTKKIYAPKGTTIKKVEVRGNLPKGYTTYLLTLKKNKFVIPFRKKIIRKGVNTVFVRSGRDIKGQYILYKRNPKF